MSAITKQLMSGPEIILTLGDGCCVECAAKREYNRLLTSIMTGKDPDPEDEIKLELLLDFLENANFAFLRSSDENLSGIKGAHCFLKRNDKGEPYVTVIDS